MAGSSAHPVLRQWTLDELRESGRSPKTPEGAYFYTIGPVVHAPKPPSQADFELEFWGRVERLGGVAGGAFRGMVQRLLRVPNVILCGGAVCSGVVRPRELPGARPDFDWFVYGVKDPREMWRVAKAFVDEARLAVAGLPGGRGTSSVSLCGSLLSIRIGGFPEMQLVLRAFDRREDITECFDIGFCGMSYDGKVTTLTERAAESVLNHTITIEPHRASATLEKRIARYLDRYGMGLLAPGMNPPETIGDIDLPRMKIKVLDQPDEFGALVQILPKRPNGAAPPASDYDLMREHDNNPYHLAVVNSVLYRNVAAVVGKGKYVISSDLFGDMQWLNNATMEGHLVVSDFVKLCDYERAIKSLCYRRMIGETSFKYKHLVKYLGFSYEEAAEIMRAISEHGALDVGDSLKRRKQAMLERFREMANDKVENWRVEDPGAQENGSLNPEPMDARAYYGSEYTEAPKSRAACGDADKNLPICSICLCAIRSDANTAILACKHVFHLGKTATCGGFISWTSRGNDTCPYCRTRVSAVDNASMSVREARGVVIPSIIDMIGRMRI